MTATAPLVATQTGDALSTHWTLLPPRQVEDIVAQVYGIQGTVTRLSSERDETFKFTARSGDAYILKIANPSEDVASLRFQDAALAHLETVASPVPLPRLVRTKHGKTNYDLEPDEGGVRTVRLLSYLAGEPAYRLRPCADRNRNIGRSLATLGQGLAGFDGRPPPGKLLWDISHTLDLANLVDHVDAGRRELVLSVLAEFERRAAPVMDALPKQVIHNDFNLHNILIDPASPTAIAGVIDFGDMVFAPRVNDLAVALAYHIDTDDWRHLVGAMLKGYSEVTQLQEQEVALLPVLLKARLAISIIIPEYRAASRPDNRDYIMRNHRPAWLGLQTLAAIPGAELDRFISSHCKD